MKQLGGIRAVADEFSQMGDDLLYAHIRRGAHTPPHALVQLGEPIRIDGMAWLLCLSGGLNIDLNLTHHELRAGTMMVIHPNSIVQISDTTDEGIDCISVFLSEPFLRDTNIDLNVLQSLRVGHIMGESPLLPLKPDDLALCRQYLGLLHADMLRNGDPALARSIARNLVAAICYQALQIFIDQRPGRTEGGDNVSRPSNYVYDFMELLHQHHRRERTVSFYASRLFITPKYLSLLVKNATGRSAAEWIDQFVVLEAKNLLRFSGRSVSQIATDLNFPNQSSFGKYFKNLTGLSPTQYQRS